MSKSTDGRSTLIKPSTIRLERLLPGPIERVWEYLTVSEKRATWLAAGEFDLRVGGRIELIFNNNNLSDEKAPPEARARGTRRFEGRITRLEPPRVLAYSWNWEGRDSDVLYELAPQGKNVLLVIHHRLPEDADLVRGVGGGWGTHTGILEDVLNGVKPRGFWSTHERLMKEFAAAN
jgi:uncharacterized protein YndB with AHSA1/START domain